MSELHLHNSAPICNPHSACEYFIIVHLLTGTLTNLDVGSIIQVSGWGKRLREDNGTSDSHTVAGGTAGI